MTLNLEHSPLHSIPKCIWFAAVESSVLVLRLINHCTFFVPYATRDSVTGIVTRLRTVRSVTGPAIFRNVHCGSGAQPAVCLMWTGGSFPRSKADGAPSWPLSSIVQVKNSGAVFPLPLYAHFACAGTLCVPFSLPKTCWPKRGHPRGFYVLVSWIHPF